LECHLGLHQGLLQRRLGLHLVDLRRLKPPLGGGRPLRHALLLRPHHSHLGRLVLGLRAGGLQLMLMLGHPGMLHLEEMRLLA